MTIHDKIQAKCHAFAADIAVLVQQVLVEAWGSAVPQQPAKRQAKRAEAAASSPKRPAAVLAELTETLASYINGNPGQRIEVIARELNTTTRELALPIRKLLGASRIRKRGRKRATTYFYRGI